MSESTKRYKVLGSSPACHKWLQTLTGDQLQELGRLDAATTGFSTAGEPRDVPREIVKDWIEEHGGKRAWWVNLTSYPMDDPGAKDMFGDLPE